LCQNCKHVVSHLGLKIGVVERLASQLGVVTLEHPQSSCTISLKAERGGKRWKDVNCGSG
jgi:hypothetical protein